MYKFNLISAFVIGILLQTQAFAGSISQSLVVKPPTAPVAPPTPPPPSINPGPLTTGDLPGTVAISTALGNYVTARDGGHRSIDALITSATTIGPYEKFTVEKIQPNYTLFKTAGGYYVSAAGSGGWSTTNDDTTMQTERTVPADDALFSVQSPWNMSGSGQLYYTIRTYGNYFLTAVGSGGKSTRAFHSDAVTASTWEWFRIQQCGDLGSNYEYGISTTGLGYQLWAAFGGGQVLNALYYNGASSTLRFKLIRQDDGSYALQTPKGYYVTAINGGGLSQGTRTYDPLVTNRTQVGAWERFRIVDQGNCTYTIQTFSGYFFAMGPGPSESTRISDPIAARAVNYNAYFVLTPVF